MSDSINLPKNRTPNLAAPTPQNTPLQTSQPPQSVLSRPAVESIEENDNEGAASDDDDDDGDADGPTGSNKGITLDPRLAPQLMSMVQGRLAGLVGKSSGYIEGLPFPVRRRVEGLKGVHAEHLKLQMKYHLEMYELEKKYAKLYEPLYARRLDIISGTAEPSAAEVAAGIESSKKDDDDNLFEDKPDEAAKDAKDVEKGIPEFWLTALNNHVGISELITQRDEAALKHLTDITLEYLPAPEPGYKLLFHFSPNEFFTNTVLTKVYHYQEEVGYLGEWVYDKAEGCTINWKEDRDLTKAVEIKKQRNKNTNRTRLVKKVIPTDSFFNFFSPPAPPTDEMLEDDDVDDEAIDDLEDRLELDYQIGEDIKDRIIPRGIDYFTGKALKYDGVAADEDDEEEFDEDDEDDNFDDDDDDEDLPAGNRRAPKDAGNKPEECQQQ